MKSEVNMKYYQNMANRVLLKLTKALYFKSMYHNMKKTHWDRKYYNLTSLF